MPGYKHIGICNLKIFDPFSLFYEDTRELWGKRLALFFHYFSPLNTFMRIGKDPDPYL